MVTTTAITTKELLLVVVVTLIVGLPSTTTAYYYVAAASTTDVEEVDHDSDVKKTLTTTPFSVSAVIDDIDDYEYPTAKEPPKPPPPLEDSEDDKSFLRTSSAAAKDKDEDDDSCRTCPWNKAVHGRYPNPSNVPKDDEQYEPIHRGKHFTVWGHWMETQYSQVFWTAQPSVPLPEDIVTKFHGRTMSITGFETDIVAQDSDTGKEWSIPEYQIYNHHFVAYVTGEGTKMVKIGERNQNTLLQPRRALGGHPPDWEPRDITTTPSDSTNTYPTAQLVVQGNGGEHRKSFKYLPRGTGQLLYSPKEFHLNPMLINTNFPTHGNQTPRQATKNATLPKNSQAPPGANYSGLLECPCTTRTHKIITGYITRSKDTCDTGNSDIGKKKNTVTNSRECFVAAQQLMGGKIIQNITLDPTDVRYPGGCFLIASSKGTEAFYNSPPPNHATAATVSQQPNCGVKDGVPIRSIGTAAVINKKKTTTDDIPDDHSTTTATTRVAIRLDLDQTNNLATITLSGPADSKWFAIGFNASVMKDQPYTIVVYNNNNNSTAVKVQERKLDNHMPGRKLPPTIKVISNTVTTTSSKSAANPTAPIRTVVMTRPLQIQRVVLQDQNGAAVAASADDYYTFDPTISSIPFIEAVGSGGGDDGGNNNVGDDDGFGYHGPTNRGGGTIVMIEVGAPVCICKTDHLGGSIDGIPWSDSCANYPATTVKRDKNPSCFIDTYQGGQTCCHHGVFLLDADQEVPAPKTRFRMKFRFYYEDPEEVAAAGGPSTSEMVYPGLGYQNAFFVFRETEHWHGEYDVPRCPKGTPPQDCIHTIKGHFQIHEGLQKCKGRSDAWCAPGWAPDNDNNQQHPPSQQHIALVHVSTHCHGPACISMELINADTNETICYTQPYYGSSDKAMDEAGYAAGIPPCIWGTPEEGLPPPPVFSMDTNLTAIKKVNSTFGHFGVMAHWQMRGIWAKDPKEFSSQNKGGRSNGEEEITRE